MRKGPLVINTRPGTQGEILHEALTNQGWHSLHIPAIRIALFDETAVEQHSGLNNEALINTLNDPNHKLIFVSRNAVVALAELVSEIPKTNKIYAIGPGTAEQLVQSFNLSIENLVVPKNTDSEGLLAERHFKRDDKVTIFKGLRGRETLTKVLSELGATVTECPLYERHAIDLSQPMQEWPAQTMIIATSVEIAESILQSAKSGDIEITDWQWIVFSHRIQQRLLQEKVEIKQIYICEQMNNSSIINTIEKTQ